MRDVKFTPTAFAQLEEWKNSSPKIYKRIDELIKHIQENPYQGIGKPEALKHDFK